MAHQKVALVTAGSAGLGACIAKALVRDGMRVVINYSSNTSRADALIAELQNSVKESATNTSDYFIAVKADMGDRDSVKRLVEETYQKMGRIDVVVSNAGWTKMRDFLNLDDGVYEEDWDRCFQINVKSHLWLFHAARPYLHETEGAFVTTASVAGIKPSGSSLPYAVTKAAQIHLVKSLAVIAAPKIRVNAVAPGVLLTEWGLSFPEEKLKAVKEQNRLKRFATVEVRAHDIVRSPRDLLTTHQDVARQVLTFAQSSSMTGQVAIIDAGFSL
ncbi:NAD(P)-binding protein [Aureobasidium pullulans]|nr:NAD(P)-binding protein [Aureobasidium pullulans]